MKKVLLLTQYSNDATYFYRLDPLFYIKQADIKIERRAYSGEISFAFFEDFDVLIMERPSGTNDLNIIKLAKQKGLKIITDWDDDCLNLPVTNPIWHHYQLCRGIILECLSLSDEVWVSTNSLKKAYSSLNKNIHVIPNAHQDYIFPVEQKKAYNLKTKKAFWRGSITHEADVYGMAPDLIKLINRNKKWQFQFIGCRFIYLELNCGANYTPVSLMPLLQYFGYMNNENPNVVFHPLQDNTFNHSKSSISWLEATFYGSAFFGNTDLPEFNKDCILPLSELSEAMSKNYFNGALGLANKESWQLICDTLLLSNINEIRKERLLEI